MGLMSDAGYQYNNHKLKNMINKAHEMGVGRGIDPFITLSFYGTSGYTRSTYYTKRRL